MGRTAEQSPISLIAITLVIITAMIADCKPLAGVCSPCPPGYGVATPCSDTRDTLCVACPGGTYSNSTDRTPCYSCSRCGDDLFELHPCNSVSDVFCEICTWEYAKDNPDYKRKCTGSAVDKWSNSHQGEPIDRMQGDQPAEGRSGDKPAQSGPTKQPELTKNDQTKHTNESVTSEKDARNKETEILPNEAKVKTEPSPIPLVKSSEDVSNETTNTNLTSNGVLAATPVAEVLQTDIVDDVNSTESDVDWSNFTESDQNVDIVTTDITQNEEEETTAVGKWGGNSQSSPHISRSETTTPVSKEYNQNGTMNGNDSVILVVGQSVDSGKVDEEEKSSAFGVVVAAVTSGIVFFAIGFFFNRHNKEPSKSKKVNCSFIQLRGHDPVMTWDDDVTCTRLQIGDDVYQELSNMRPTEYTEMVPRQQTVAKFQPGVPQVVVTSDQDVKTPQVFGSYQSPVNIEPEDADVDEALEKNPLSFKYVPENTKSISNTGALMRIEVDGTDSLIRGGPLNHRYQLDHIHFHWGSTDDHGSEHTVKGATYAAEVHFVHWNTDLYKSFAEAVKAEYGLTIVGVLMEIGQKHKALQTITNLLPYVRYKGETRDLNGSYFDPKSLLPDNTIDYWTYQGSMTTPPFYESVTWVVFKESMEISREQINAFRQLLSHERDEGHGVSGDAGDGRILQNYRSTLPLGDRTVKASFV